MGQRFCWVSHKTKGSITAAPLFLKHILHLTSYFLHRKLVSHKNKGSINPSNPVPFYRKL